MRVALIGTVGNLVFSFRGDLINALISRGHEVFVFAINFTEDEKKRLREMGVVPIDYVLSRSGLNPLADLSMMFYLKRKLDEIKPDVVLSYFVKPVIFGSLAAKLAKVPNRVAMLEGLGFAFTAQPEGLAWRTRLIQRIQLFLYRIAFPATTKLIFLNPDDRDELLLKHKLKAPSVDILGGIGLNLIEYPYTPPVVDKIRFLFIGRLLKEKGIFDFLAAAERVKIQFQNVEFIILGATDTTSPNALSEKELEAYIQEDVIIYPGQVSNVQDWIIKSSVFVLPSYREGVPRSTQEAMSIGRPVITTDVPGCRETVIENINGFIVPPFDSNALAEKMIWFIKNPQRIQPMGLASRKIAEDKFDVEKINRRMIELLGLKN